MEASTQAEHRSYAVRIPWPDWLQRPCTLEPGKSICAHGADLRLREGCQGRPSSLNLGAEFQPNPVGWLPRQETEEIVSDVEYEVSLYDRREQTQPSIRGNFEGRNSDLTHLLGRLGSKSSADAPNSVRSCTRTN